MFWPAKPPLRPGDAAPPFALPDAGGHPVSLLALRGKRRAVLAFYPQDDTPG